MERDEKTYQDFCRELNDLHEQDAKRLSARLNRAIVSIGSVAHGAVELIRSQLNTDVVSTNNTLNSGDDGKQENDSM